MSAEELVTFLDSPKEEIVQIALENLLPFSSNNPQIFQTNNNKGFESLKKISQTSLNPDLVQNALIALVNLTSEQLFRSDLAKNAEALKTYVKYAVANPKLSLTKYAVMLLNNISREPEFVETMSNPLLTVLVLTAAKPENSKDTDYDFLVMAFNEIARQSPSKIAQLLPILFTELVNGTLNRRKGIAATIKNCLFETKLHEPFCLDTPLVETIMISLKGPEQLDQDDFASLPQTVREVCGDRKSREPDSGVQYLLMECLLLISSTHVGRETLRRKHTYYVVRELHKASDDPQLAKLCEEYVNMVLRGEPEPDTKSLAIENGDNNEDDIVEIV